MPALLSAAPTWAHHLGGAMSSANAAAQAAARSWLELTALAHVRMCRASMMCQPCAHPAPGIAVVQVASVSARRAFRRASICAVSAATCAFAKWS